MQDASVAAAVSMIEHQKCICCYTRLLIKFHHLIRSASYGSTCIYQRFPVGVGLLMFALRAKDHHISYAQLAKEWLLKSNHILHMPFLDTAYSTTLEAAEQFLWGDHDLVAIKCCLHDMRLQRVGW